MKNTLGLFLLLVSPAAAAPKPPVPVWELAEGLAQPESAWFDAASAALFISNVAGTPDGRDGKGWITRADAQGKVETAQWLSGLNAPKGLRSRGGKLYAADLDEVVEIDIAGAFVTRRMKAPGAKILNDVEVDEQGNVYASDTLSSKIYMFNAKGEESVLIEGKELESPNGLYLRGGTLYVAAWGLAKEDWSTEKPGRLLAVDLKTKKVTVVGAPAGNLDGLEPWKDGWLVSDFTAGKVYYRGAKGKTRVLLSGLKGAADLGIGPQGFLIVPQMQADKVSAYDLVELLK